MTRTEKYYKYREEIKHSLFDEKDFSTKRISAELVESLIKGEERQTNSLTIDELLFAHEPYEPKQKAKTKKKMNLTHRNKLVFYIFMSIIIASLLVGVIITGINVFGG